MNGCEDFLDLLDLFLDGELPPDQMLRVQEHLDACPACREYVDDALTLRAAFPSIEDTVVPEGFAGDVMERIRAGTPKPVVLHRRRWMSMAAALVACCAIVVLLRSGPVGMGGGMNDSAAMMERGEDAVAMEETEESAAYDDVMGQSAGDTPADSGKTDDTDGKASADMENASAFDVAEEKEKEAGKVFRNTSGTAPQPKSVPAEDLQEAQDDSDAGIPSALSEPASGYDNDASADLPGETALTAGSEEAAPAAPEEAEAPLMMMAPTPAPASAKADGPDLILSQEEAGDLLDGFTPTEDNGSERTYLLTQEEFAGLMEELDLEYVQTEQKDLMTVLVTVA